MNFSNRESIEREVKQTIADCLKVELNVVKDKSTFDSLGVESLTFTEILLSLDDRYAYALGDEDIRALSREATYGGKQLFDYLTVKRFIAYINSKYETEALAHT